MFNQQQSGVQTRNDWQRCQDNQEWWAWISNKKQPYGPAFSSFFKVGLVSFCSKPGIWHMSTIILVPFGTAILLGIYQKSMFYCSGNLKIHVEHPQKMLRFLDGFVFHHRASTSFLFTPTCGQSWQWCRRHLHSYECTAIAKPWHMSWSLQKFTEVQKTYAM